MSAMVACVFVCYYILLMMLLDATAAKAVCKLWKITIYAFMYTCFNYGFMQSRTAVLLA